LSEETEGEEVGINVDCPHPVHHFGSHELRPAVEYSNRGLLFHL
jgi:hypothetical protein